MSFFYYDYETFNNSHESCLSMVSTEQRKACFVLTSQAPTHSRALSLSYSCADIFLRTSPLTLCYEMVVLLLLLSFSFVTTFKHNALYEMAQPLKLSFPNSFTFQDVSAFKSSALMYSHPHIPGDWKIMISVI